MRTEKDSFGEMQVPDDAYYGVHTLRSMLNFNVAKKPYPSQMIQALVKLKMACARANAKMGALPLQKAQAIEKACRRILSGEFSDQFPVDLFQAGSGTSSNMNSNEVIANIAAEILGGKKGDRHLVHPNDDVNRGQSTNDLTPSAIKVASYELSDALVASLASLIASLQKKEQEFSTIIKSGRTHLQDAVPITLGQEFSAYARALEKAKSRIERSKQSLRELAVGGNAIGTGINTKKELRKTIIDELNDITKKDFLSAQDGIEAVQSLTDVADYSSSLKLLSLDLLKFANDLRLLTSGPNTGFNEIKLPAVEPGSSIMPGKINPSICEAANMACMQVLGYDHAIALAVGAGQLELNTHMPLIGHNIIESTQILDRCCAMLSEKCVKGIVANEEMCRKHFESSGALATLLNPKFGYDKVAELVKESLQRKMTLREIILEKKLMPEEEFDELLLESTKPNL